MTIEFNQLNVRDEYLHVTQGTCTFISTHPHDGAYLIMERLSADDGETDEFFGCVREELTLKDPK